MNDNGALTIDREALATELLTALRGSRSQRAWSKHLGYKSNVAYTWEAGRRWPTAAEAMRAAQRGGVDVRASWVAFYGRTPSWLRRFEPTTSEGIARFLEDLRGDRTVADLARASGLSRFSITRWLSGQTQPKLPDFLHLVEVASLRVVDLVAELVDPSTLPSVRDHWRLLETRRRGAYELPWTQAILHTLELEDYRHLDAHRDGWLAHRLGISPEDEYRAVDFLRSTNQIVWDGAHYRPRALAVDTRKAPQTDRQLKAHWSRVAADRVAAGSAGQFSYNVFAVSRKDFERIRELHLAYFRHLRAIVAASEPVETVAVANVQLFALDEMPARKRKA